MQLGYGYLKSQTHVVVGKSSSEINYWQCKKYAS